MPSGTTTTTDSTEQRKALVLGEAAQLWRSRPGDPLVADAEYLLELYYHHVPVADLGGRDVGALLDAVTGHLQVAAGRIPGSAAVLVHTPTVHAGYGASGRTVVQIVTEDAPFLVDSIITELRRQGRTVRLVIHPLIPVRRDVRRRLSGVDPGGDAAESWLRVEIDRVDDHAELKEITRQLHRVLADVRVADADWSVMARTALGVAAELVSDPRVGSESSAAEAQALLGWMAENRATMLGYQQYMPSEEALVAVPGSGLGLLRNPAPGAPPILNPIRLQEPGGSDPMVIRKTGIRSSVHRASYLDRVDIRRFDAEGALVVVHRFLGLLSAGVVTDSVLNVPVLRRKVNEVLGRSGFPPLSHSGKDLYQILETYPRDELFHADVADLRTVALSVLHLKERRQLRLFLRQDRNGAFLSCLVFLPRDLYTRTVRLGMQRVVQQAFGAATVDHTARVTESVLACVHFLVRMEPGQRVPDVDAAALQKQLAAVARTWGEDLSEILVGQIGEEEAERLLGTYANAFPEAYKQDLTVSAAAADLRRIDGLAEAGGLAMSLYRPPGATEGQLRFKVYSSRAVSLSAVLPVLGHMAADVVDSRPYQLHRGDGTLLYLYDFGLRAAGALHHETAGLDALFQDAFAAVWNGDAEDDGYNALVLCAGLAWRQALVLRAYGKYLHQTGWNFSQDEVHECLLTHVSVARLLIRLFDTQFDPDLQVPATRTRDELSEQIAAEIDAAVEAVPSLDQDRILRSFLAAVRATTRTNFFQHRTVVPAGERPHRAYVSFKLDPTGLLDLPQPRPEHEIWVYSPRVEGVHLRFGAVARGGLRWSDRRADLRTEVLGLAKAQTVKNAVIVPVGPRAASSPRRWTIHSPTARRGSPKASQATGPSSAGSWT